MDVYAPGSTTPEATLTNSSIFSVYGIGVDANNNAYASGVGSSGGVVVEYTNLSEPGANLGLTDLDVPAGVTLDKRGDLVVSDFALPGINIYPPGATTPSNTIASGESPDRSGFDKKKKRLYVPEGSNSAVNIYSYPSGNLVNTLSFSGSGHFISGVALSPAPKD